MKKKKNEAFKSNSYTNKLKCYQKKQKKEEEEDNPSSNSGVLY